MANFTATVRRELRDVSGLVLSCGRDDIEEDPHNPGFIKRWRNRAPGLPSKPQYRSVSTPKTYDGGRFGDPQQLVKALQPSIVLTGGGQKRVKFEQAFGQFLNVPIPNAVGEAPSDVSVGYQITPGAGTGLQVIFVDLSFPMYIERDDGTGLALFDIGGDSAIGPGDHPAGTMFGYGDGSVAVDWRLNNTPYASTGAAVTPGRFAASPNQAWIGGYTGMYCLDAIMDAIHIWTRAMSPKERDFVWSVLNEDGVSYNTALRGKVALQDWTDSTGNLSLNQVNRLRPIIGANPVYKLVTVPNAGALPVRVQLAASVDGLTLPDTALGGDLFSFTWIEFPSIVPPIVEQDAGWSAVVDCLVVTPGHYTACIARQNGGKVYLHFDVQVVP